mgnify:FL=1
MVVKFSNFFFPFPHVINLLFRGIIIGRTNDSTLGSFLLYTLRGRYKDILSKAHSASISTTPKTMQLLSREETLCKLHFPKFYYVP